VICCNRAAPTNRITDDATSLSLDVLKQARSRHSRERAEDDQSFASSPTFIPLDATNDDSRELPER